MGDAGLYPGSAGDAARRRRGASRRAGQEPSHFHHGDQYTIVQEGEIKITVDGDGEHVLRAGQVLHIPPMTVHRTQNLSGKPARTTEFFIVAKGKPLTEKAE
jgi:quercetin dioxygenase-like cupin family protein